MLKKLIIDRLEGDIAVAETENGEYIHIPRSMLPGEAAEGSIIRESFGEYCLDKETTALRRAEMAAKMRALFDKQSGSR